MGSLSRKYLARLIEVFGIMIAHVVFHPPERDLSVKTVFSGALPSFGWQGEQEIDMLLPEIGEIVEDFARVLAAVVPLDRPESIVITRNLGGIFLYEAVCPFEVDLFPVAEVRQDFDDSPTAVASGAVERVVIMRGEQEPAQIVGKAGEVFQDLFARTSGWFHSLPEMSTRRQRLPARHRPMAVPNP